MTAAVTFLLTACNYCGYSLTIEAEQPMEPPMTPTRKTLIAMLGFVQNSVEHQHHDIMTFSGFMSDAELPGYIFEQVKQIKSAKRLGELAFRFTEAKQLAA